VIYAEMPLIYNLANSFLPLTYSVSENNLLQELGSSQSQSRAKEKRKK
jgi:hypothetical protein